MSPTLRPTRALILLAAASALPACNQPDPATRTEEGVYGAASGDNPNLSDLQQQPGQTQEELGPAEPPQEGGASDAGANEAASPTP
ncbi:MAG TPA: hypothetical protein VEA80_06855 [Vitreimonas sp.]|uniref:hypothetical protein n=1 Tax=Vitreimonas sp. TaxID=3069702 RepID=UPI002D416EB3|nr:hypothetical protein [Vitreimonas sp.]HYD87174.1 hypothetical protein [Vitreimonas sp.]